MTQAEVMNLALAMSAIHDEMAEAPDKGQVATLRFVQWTGAMAVAVSIARRMQDGLSFAEAVRAELSA